MQQQGNQWKNKVEDKFYYTKEKYPRIVNEMNKYNDMTTIYQWRRQYSYAY